MSKTILRQTLPEQIYRILREDILTQEIPCGAKLTLQSLKDRFGVSHTPIREALTRLVEDGLVNYYSNVGISVISLDAKDVREVFKLSYDFDLLAIKYALAGGKRPALLKALEENIAACRGLLKNGDVDPWRILSDDFHLAFYRFADNSRLESASYRLRAQLTLIYNMNRIEEINCRKIQEYHDEMFACLKKGDIEGAGATLHTHIQEDMELALSGMGKEK